MKRILLTLIAAAAVTAPLRGGSYAEYYRDMPVALSEPAAPQIPSGSVSILDFGGCGDGVTSNTQAFAKAISALRKQGGGHLIVPAGVYLSGPITLKERIDLHLERNAIIVFSPDRSEHLKDGKARPCISASKSTDVSITGEGIIDGNGEWWRGVKRSKVSDVEWKRFKSMGGRETEDGKLWYPFGLKNSPDISEDMLEQEKMRTHMIRFTDCTRVLVQGVTVQNSPKFHIVPSRCSDVIIDGVTVRCPWNAQNGDGIDIMQSRNVLIVNNTVDVGDDGICLKGGVGAKAAEGGPCDNILIADNTVFHAHGGFVIGSEFSAGISRIVVRNNSFSGTDTGLRFKSGAGRGGVTSDIWISDIYMTDINDEAIVFQTGYVDRPVGHENAQGLKTEEFLPDFRDIHISNVVCRGTRTGIAAKGSISTIHDISLRGCTIFYTDKAADIDDPSMFNMENVRLLTFE